MTLDMFVRLVVLFCLHSISSAGSLNETSSDCDEIESCVRLCCVWDDQESVCQNVSDPKQFEEFRNLKLYNIDIRHARTCELQPFEHEWSFEVSFLHVSLFQLDKTSYSRTGG